jgi:predicted transcriptional regulator
MKREKAMEAVKNLPEDFALEELIERLVFIEKVEKGLAQVEEGKIVPHSQIKEMVKKW